MKLIICGSEGQPVHETQEGMKANGIEPNRKPFVGSVFGFAVHPGEALQQKIDLTKEYKLNKPGTYTVLAHEYDAFSHTTVKSNKITITITP